MHQNTLMVSKVLREKVLIWFKLSNRYLVCDTVIHSMLKDLESGITKEALVKTIALESELELEAIKDIVTNVIELRETYLNPLEVIPQYNQNTFLKLLKLNAFLK